MGHDPSSMPAVYGGALAFFQAKRGLTAPPADFNPDWGRRSFGLARGR